MTSPHPSTNKDVYGHISLLALLFSATVLLSGILWLSLITGSFIGLFLVFLYYQRIKKIEIHATTPISDVFIALGGLISTIYLLGQLTFVPIPNSFSSLSPFMAIGALTIGIFSKLFLVEELFRGIASGVNNSFNKMIKWTLKSRKNKMRVLLAVVGLLLFMSRGYVESANTKEIITSISLVTFSIIALLDINQVPQLSNRRKIISSSVSIILLSRFFTVSSDFNNIGNTILGLSLLISSINRYRIYSWIASAILLIRIFFNNFYIELKSTIRDIFVFVRLHIIIILRLLSFIFGIILILIPSSNSVDLGIISVDFNLFLGFLLIISSILPTLIKWTKLYGIRIGRSIKNFIIISYKTVHLISASIYYWIRQNNRQILRFLSTIFSVGLIFRGPTDYLLNYLVGCTLLALTHKTYFLWISSMIYKQMQKLLNYLTTDFSRISGYMGLFGLIGSYIIKDDYTTLSFLLLVVSAILVGLGWDFMIYRFIDSIVNFVILILDGLIRAFTRISLFIYHGITIRKFISITSWIMLLLAIFNVLLIGRWILVVLWVILWHLAYPHRVDRMKKQLTQFLRALVTFSRHILVGLFQLIRNIFIRLRIVLISIVVTIYSHTVVILLWAIGLFLLILGIGLILPFSLSLTERVFGEVANNTLISFIIGIVLFSAAILSIQQTYLRREKLLIGGLTN